MGDDPRNQEDHMSSNDPLSRTYAAISNSQHLGLAPETEASPQSGANKVTLYSQLQTEIRNEAQMRSNLDPYAVHKQPFLDPSTISPSKDYYYAERAKQGALATIGTSPERERPAKKINPYDCFRSGEARQSIVQHKKVNVQTSSPQRLQYQEETTPTQ